jgi:acetyl-CoA carboxylase biotin carboxyl carrier protein
VSQVDSKELRELRKLIEFISESDLSEFEMEKEGLRLRLSRAAGAPVVQTVQTVPVAAAPAPAPVAAAEPAPAAPVAPASPEATPAAPAVEEGLEEVRSPIVGTFYRSPRPDASPFVEKGDRVELGQVLCIVEAMKVMNEIEAEVAGEIVEVLTANAQPVEFDEVLFRIRPSV